MVFDGGRAENRLDAVLPTWPLALQTPEGGPCAVGRTRRHSVVLSARCVGGSLVQDARAPVGLTPPTGCI